MQITSTLLLGAKYNYKQIHKQVVIRADVKFKTKGNAKFADLVKEDISDKGIGSDTIQGSYGQSLRQASPFDTPTQKQAIIPTTETPFLDEFVDQFKAPDFGKPDASWPDSKTKPVTSNDPFAQFNGPTNSNAKNTRRGDEGRVLEQIMSPNFLSIDSSITSGMKTPFD